MSLFSAIRLEKRSDVALWPETQEGQRFPEMKLDPYIDTYDPFEEDKNEAF